MKIGSSTNAPVLIHIGIGAAADFFLAFYPVYIIGKLQLMKLSTKVGLCLIMGGGLMYVSPVKFVTNFLTFHRAGIAGINKTLAIASITQVEDLTYAIFKLNTWVLTEMWFIIIFGSIPVLRPFFVRFTQDIRSAIDDSSKRSDTSRRYLSESRNRRESWVQLSDRPLPNFSTNVAVFTSASHYADQAQADDDYGATGRHIIVTKDTTVTSEHY